MNSKSVNETEISNRMLNLLYITNKRDNFFLKNILLCLIDQHQMKILTNFMMNLIVQLEFYINIQEY